MAQKITPTQFDLQGQGVSINYSTSGIAGKPLITVKKGRQTLNFTGDEIGVLGTIIGSLITVTIARTVDRGFTTFSFLLPAIELSSAANRPSFQTIGLTTVHKTTIAGPVKGPQQSYKTTPLRGTAQQVASVTHRTAGA